MHRLLRLGLAALAVGLLAQVGAGASTADPGESGPEYSGPEYSIARPERLAARALAYKEPIEYSGPLFQTMTVEGKKAVLSFTHVGKGLEAKGGTLTGFTIAGEDGKFVFAHAEIDGDKVVVWHDKVEKPAAVRYGWANHPYVNLWNKDGLPASPFRTDDWPVVGPKKP